MKTSLRWALPVVFAAASMATPALSDGYNKPQLRVMSGSSVVSIPYTNQLPYQLGQDLFLKRKTMLPPTASGDFLTAEFEVRLFRINNSQSDPQSWLTNMDGCDVFLSLVFKHLKFRGDTVPLGPLESDHWLTLMPNGYFAPGHFLLVIEQDSAADRSSERDPHWEVFRLASASRHEYFKRAIPIEVDPRYGDGPPVSPPSEDTLIKQALAAVADAISAKFNCYQPQLAGIAAEGNAGLLLASCTVQSPAHGG